MKSILYYTDNRIEEPIKSMVQKLLTKVGLPIVSVSLGPVDFGKNVVLDLKPGIITMFRQILTGLENSVAKYVFFTEHDVLYHKSHFEFIPSRDDIFYYNTNVWRLDYPGNRIITYDNLKSLSGLCANRELLINDYKKRLKTIEDNGWTDSSHEPRWARRMSYEPGKRRGGISDQYSEEWKSNYPNIDIRHSGTITKRKCQLSDFKHKPINWQESTLDKIKGWEQENFQF